MSLWMRWLNFRALRDLLLLVERHPSGLRAYELERLATDERVLLRRDGRPYAQTMHYHHRRTLERLGLLEKQNRRLILNYRNPEVGVLVSRSKLREELQAPEKAAFANAVLRDADCYNVFFGNFVQAREEALDVATFVEGAHPVQIVVQTGSFERKGSHGIDGGGDAAGAPPKEVRIRASGTTKWRVLYGANAVQAIHFGLRSWCVDQLGFLDITYRTNGTYTAYPKHIVPQMTDQELAVEMFAALDFAGDWATIRVPDCALATGISQRVSVAQAKGVLMGWLTDHSDLVAGLPTRVGFITAGLPESQHALALKSYLRSRSGAYLSHLRIHRTLREHMQNGGSRS